MIIPVLTGLALAWIAIGTGLAWVALREFHDPARQPDREVWRRRHLDRYHTDTGGTSCGPAWECCGSSVS